MPAKTSALSCLVTSRLLAAAESGRFWTKRCSWKHRYLHKSSRNALFDRNPSGIFEFETFTYSVIFWTVVAIVAFESTVKGLKEAELTLICKQGK